MFLLSPVSSLLLHVLSILLPSFSLSFHLPDSSPLLGLGVVVRQRHLYTENHRKGIYLQMSPDGRVSGSLEQTPHSVLELRSLHPGQTVIRGHSSSLYLCVDGEGSLRGQSRFSEADCSFRELLLGDGYTRFLSSHHGLPVSLAPRPSSEKPSLPFTRFLPLPSRLVEEPESQHLEPRDHVDLDSEDPLRMSLRSVVSPQFSMDV